MYALYVSVDVAALDQRLFSVCLVDCRSTKDRPGGKSYSQIASLFKGGASDEDDEDGTK